MFKRKQKVVSFSSQSQTLFKNNFLIWGNSDLKKMAMLDEFVLGMGEKSGHSVSICNTFEAEYIKRNHNFDKVFSKPVFIEPLKAMGKVFHDDDIVKPVTVFKLMIKMVQSRAANASGEDIWLGRANYMFNAMVPYLESIFTEYKTVAGVDITDTSSKAMIEKEVTLETLKDAMKLPSIKSWLRLQKDSPENERLYSAISDIPGFQDLSDSREVEIHHYCFLTMMADGHFNDVAALLSLIEDIKLMKAMMAEGNGHMIISIPDVDLLEDKHADAVSDLLQSEILATLASQLGSRIDDTRVDVLEPVSFRSKYPMYISGEFLRQTVKASLLSQLRSLGYVVGAQIAQCDRGADEQSLTQKLRENVMSVVILDKDGAVSYEGHTKKTFNLCSQMGKGMSLLVNRVNEECNLVNLFE